MATEYVQHLFPYALITELIRVAKINRDWVTLQPLPGERYKPTCHVNTWLMKAMQQGQDYLGMHALSLWLVDGPKMFRPSIDQCKALEQIEVRLLLEEYAQPYPAILVDLPSGHGYEPFKAVLVCNGLKGAVTCSLISKGNANDIVTTCGIPGRSIEESIQRFDEECSGTVPQAIRALRVGLNSCLALVNYGSVKSALFPHEVARDERLSKEDSERGEKARERLQTHIQLVSFQQEVTLHKTEGSHQKGEGTGRETSPHWRRGHWAMQAYGPQHSLRKRILRPPVLVRQDLFVGDTSNTQATYR